MTGAGGSLLNDRDLHDVFRRDGFCGRGVLLRVHGHVGIDLSCAGLHRFQDKDGCIASAGGQVYLVADSSACGRSEGRFPLAQQLVVQTAKGDLTGVVDGHGDGECIAYLYFGGGGGDGDLGAEGWKGSGCGYRRPSGRRWLRCGSVGRRCFHGRRWRVRWGRRRLTTDEFRSKHHSGRDEGHNAEQTRGNSYPYCPGGKAARRGRRCSRGW
jgi:hypothetical protein